MQTLQQHYTEVSPMPVPEQTMKAIPDSKSYYLNFSRQLGLLVMRGDLSDPQCRKILKTQLEEIRYMATLHHNFSVYLEVGSLSVRGLGSLLLLMKGLGEICGDLFTADVYWNTNYDSKLAVIAENFKEAFAGRVNLIY